MHPVKFWKIRESGKLWNMNIELQIFEFLDFQVDQFYVQVEIN